MKMNTGNLSDRLLDFSAGIVRYCIKLNRSPSEKHIGLQLIRSSTSAGANYEEARGAESRSDFIHKMQIVLKELRESFYWIRLLIKLRMVDVQKFKELKVELEELLKIIGKSVVTARKNKNEKR